MQNQAAPKAKHFAGFDGLRLIAAVSVIFSHSFLVATGSEENEPLVRLLGMPERKDVQGIGQQRGDGKAEDESKRHDERRRSDAAYGHDTTLAALHAIDLFRREQGVGSHETFAGARLGAT